MVTVPVTSLTNDLPKCKSRQPEGIGERFCPEEKARFWMRIRDKGGKNGNQ